MTSTYVHYLFKEHIAHDLFKEHIVQDLFKENIVSDLFIEKSSMQNTLFMIKNKNTLQKIYDRTHCI